METCFDLLPEDMLLVLMRYLKQDSYILCSLSEYINKIQCKYINNIMNGDYEEDDIFPIRDVSSSDKSFLSFNIILYELIYDDKNITTDDFRCLIYNNISKVLTRVKYEASDYSYLEIFKLKNNSYVAMKYNDDSNLLIYNYNNYRELMKNLLSEIKLYLLINNNYKSKIIKTDGILPTAIEGD